MKSNRIPGLLMDFETNDQKAILIDGKWGIGKTYHLNEYLKDYEKRNKLNKKNRETDVSNDHSKVKVYYISIFGLKSIDEIHTLLYNKLHPVSKVALNLVKIVTPATRLIPTCGETVSESIQHTLGAIENSNKRLKSKKNKNNIIIIFDDLERTTIDYIELLGYFNQLFLQGFKIVCICNISEIAKNDNNCDDGRKNDNSSRFESFKEKVFDRIYSIRMADKDVINSFFPKVLLREEIYDVFGENLRLASKTALFFNEVCGKINSLKDSGKKIINLSDDEILWNCALVVSGFNNGPFLSKICPSNDDGTDIINFQIEENAQNDDEKNILLKITKYDEQNNPDRTCFAISLLLATANAFLYNDFEEFEKLIVEVENDDKSIYGKALFYLSSNEKRKQIELILDDIYKAKEIGLKKLQYIENMLFYMKYFPENFDLDFFVKKCASLICFNDQLENNLHMMTFGYPTDFIEIVKRIIDEVDSIKRVKIYSDIEKNINLNNISSIESVKKIIMNNSNLCTILVANAGFDIAPEIKAIFEKNGWYLKSLENHIEEDTWKWNKSICSFMADYPSLKQGALASINAIFDKSNDESEKERIKLLKTFLR